MSSYTEDFILNLTEVISERALTEFAFYSKNSHDTGYHDIIDHIDPVKTYFGVHPHQLNAHYGVELEDFYVAADVMNIAWRFGHGGSITESSHETLLEVFQEVFGGGLRTAVAFAVIKNHPGLWANVLNSASWFGGRNETTVQMLSEFRDAFSSDSWQRYITVCSIISALEAEFGDWDVNLLRQMDELLTEYGDDAITDIICLSRHGFSPEDITVAFVNGIDTETLGATLGMARAS